MGSIFEDLASDPFVGRLFGGDLFGGGNPNGATVPPPPVPKNVMAAAAPYSPNSTLDSGVFGFGGVSNGAPLSAPGDHASDLSQRIPSSEGAPEWLRTAGPQGLQSTGQAAGWPPTPGTYASGNPKGYGTPGGGQVAAGQQLPPVDASGSPAGPADPAQGDTNAQDTGGLNALPDDVRKRGLAMLARQMQGDPSLDGNAQPPGAPVDINAPAGPQPGQPLDINAPGGLNVPLGARRPPMPTPADMNGAPPTMNSGGGLAGALGLSNDGWKSALAGIGRGMENVGKMRSGAPKGAAFATGLGGGVTGNIAEQDLLQQRALEQQRLQSQQDKDAQRFAETQRHNRMTEGRPVQVGKDRYGAPIFGRMDPKTGLPLNMDGTPYTGEAPEDKNANLTGEDFVKTLPAADANAVRQILKYEYPLPSAGSRSPKAQRLLDYAMQADPNINAMTYPVRQAMVKDFSATTGTHAGANIVAAGTAINHMAHMKDQIEELDHKPTMFIPLNRLSNMAQNTVGLPQMKSLQMTADAVGSELAKTFRGPGSMSDTETAEWRKNLDAASSLPQFKAILRNGVKLLEGRMSNMGEMYDRTMGTAGYDPLTKTARKNLETVKGAWGSDVQPGAPQGGGLPQFKSVEDVQAAIAAKRLKRGDSFLDANGVTRTVP